MPQQPTPLDLAELIGRPPMSVADLLVEVNKAGWPHLVKVTPQDFLFLTPPLAMGLGAMVKYEEETGQPYIMLAGTKVQPKEAKGFLDLTGWTPPEPSLIEVPGAVKVRRV